MNSFLSFLNDPRRHEMRPPKARPAPRWLAALGPLALLAFGCSSDDEAGPAGDSSGGSAATGGSGSGAGGSHADSPVDCSSGFHVGRAPLRRLTRFEYNKTAEALFSDTSGPGNSLPPEISGNGFGNDADAQPVSSFLVEQYSLVGEDLGQSAIENAELMRTYAPCYESVTSENEESCARTFIENFSRQAYRRPLEESELTELVTLQQEIAAFTDYSTSLASVVEAVVQSPDFLYRLEFGEPDAENPELLRPSGHEMATRLSYFFWGASPDDALQAAAEAGELSDAQGVLAQASRLLDDPRARDVVRFFFSRFLPIEGLTDLARDEEQYPDFSPQIGALMKKETETFLEYVIFTGEGDWATALRAPYTFVNEQLANYYGFSGVTGEEFQMFDLPADQRKGLLTQGAIMTGSTVSNFTNPVRRGVFLLRNIMCMELPEPPESIAENIMPPDPYSGDTGRQRYSAHAAPACAQCHSTMDPPGFALENYDAVGKWRDQENGVTIDASGEIPALSSPFSGPMDLVELIASDPQTHACFAEKWFTYASGRSLTEEDACLLQGIEHEFSEAGYDVKELLLRITQTDAFLYLPNKEAL